MKGVGVLLSVCLIIFVTYDLVAGKVFTKCGLYSALQQRDFPRSFLGNWICLIESESGKNTSLVVDKANGGKGLGLFQINSKEWCTFGKAGGKCNMKCEDLTDEDIDDDCRCAKKVFNLKGFQGWAGWNRSCYKRQLPLPVC